MNNDISTAFSKHFGAEVHQAYQRMGSKLRKMVRNRGNVRGTTTHFQTIGSGTAKPKARNADVPVMQVAHAAVACELHDYYAGDWIDRLDEIKIDYDERDALVNASAYALGRKTDELIIAAATAAVKIKTRHTLTNIHDGMTKVKVLNALETLGLAGVPDDGQRCAVVSWKQWGQLLGIEEFANSQYVGSDELPWLGSQAKKWLGTFWMPHSGLYKDTNKRRFCFWFHKTAIGHAVNAEINTDISWSGERAAYFVNSSMSQGAVVIDPNGIAQLVCKEV